MDASARAGAPCPFPVLLVAFVGIILLAAALMVFVPAFKNVGMPLFGSAAATGVAIAIVELRRRRANSCPWLDFGDAKRAIMYFLLFIVGLAVVFPGVWPSRDVEWVFRIPFALLAVAGVALLKIHSTVDHGELEEAGVARSIYFASRLPLYILVTLGVMAAIVAVLALVGVGR